MILIVGATGYLGRETVRQLLAAGYPVRAAARDPQKADDLAKLGAEVVQADLNEPASLARACQGVDEVLATAHSLLGSGKNNSAQVDGVGHRALIDAAKTAGVKHFVYTSMLGVGPNHPIDFCRTKYQTEGYLKASGLNYTILRPSAFMEWHAHNFLGKGILETGKTSILGGGNNPVNFVAVKDVARFAVLALTDPRAKGQTIEIGGPENFTKNEVAAMYGRISGREPKISHLPVPVMHIMGFVLRPFNEGVSRIMRLGAYENSADMKFDPRQTEERFPVPLTRLEDFIREKVAEKGS